MLNNPRVIASWTGVVVVVLVLVSCHQPRRGAVTGKVTLGDQAIDGGSILFVPVQGHQNEAGWAEIHAGEYRIAAVDGPAVGLCRVEIRWPRKTGRKRPDDPSLDEWQEVVPDRYHQDTQLQADIKPGRNQFDFALQSP